MFRYLQLIFSFSSQESVDNRQWCWHLKCSLFDLWSNMHQRRRSFCGSRLISWRGFMATIESQSRIYGMQIRWISGNTMGNDDDCPQEMWWGEDKDLTRVDWLKATALLLCRLTPDWNESPELPICYPFLHSSGIVIFKSGSCKLVHSESVNKTLHLEC